MMLGKGEEDLLPVRRINERRAEDGYSNESRSVGGVRFPSSYSVSEQWYVFVILVRFHP